MNQGSFATAAVGGDGGAFTPSVPSEADRLEAARIMTRWGQLEIVAINWKTHWQECYEFIVPRKEDVIATRLPGDRRNSDLYDTTAILANEMLASALHGMLTNPETRFFELVFGDPELDEDEEVKAWCQEAGDRMFRVINNSNFQTEIHETYIDIGAIGTACMFMGEHEDSIVHFSARAMKEIRIDENHLGLIDVVYRTFKLRPHQIIAQFGSKNCPEEIIRAAEKGSQDQMEIIHAVEPMNELEKGNPKSHTYKSTYVMAEKKFILSKGGFREFPFAVPRWTKTTGEIYGRGPGMSMLPDIMMVNAMMLTVIQGAQKTVDPPLMVTDDGVIGVVRLQPGGLTIVRPGSENTIRPLITDARIDFGQKIVEDVRNRIRAGFYVDQFQLAQGPQKTAEEVVREVEQKLRLMGPVLGRQHFELLAPLIERVYGIMERKEMFSPPPNKIKGKTFQVRYSSMIARAQRMSEALNISKALQIIEPMAQVIPSIIDNVDGDKIARELWDIMGNKHGLLKPQKDVDKIRDQKAKMAQEQMKQQQQLHESQVAKNAAPMASVMQNAQQPQQG